MVKKTLFKGTNRDWNYAYNQALKDVLRLIDKLKEEGKENRIKMFGKSKNILNQTYYLLLN
jgi:hypothetical protein